MRTNSKAFTALALWLTAIFAAGAAAAQDAGSQPVRLVVPFAAGGSATRSRV
jgi:tripartite-type tricarboxylate transporter receptor subunit TctC